MANKYDAGYTKEWINDPAEQADAGTQKNKITATLAEFPVVASADVLYIEKLQHKGYFLGLESLVGALGAGAVQAIDKDANVTVLAKGDIVNGQIEGGLNIVLVADGASAAAIKLLCKWSLT